LCLPHTKKEEVIALNLSASLKASGHQKDPGGHA
jgi:hypothetical protein